MLSNIICPLPKAGSVSFPSIISDLEKLKAFLDCFVNGKISIKTTPHTRYKPSDFIFVKLFSLLKNKSIHDAAEYLNTYFTEQLKRDRLILPQQFKDKKRLRRLIPHQTDVNKFIRCLTETDVKTIMGGLLDYQNQQISETIIPYRTWISIADNTKFPFYGKPDPLKHIGSNHLPGTKVCWMFQAISVHSTSIHLFTDIFSLSKGVYRAKDVPNAVNWLKWCGMDIKVAEFDREFYRAALVAELAKYNIRCTFPTKKFQWVKHHMENYLNGTGGLIVGNIFSQNNNLYPYQQSAFVRMVIIGKDKKKAWDVQADYQAGKLSLTEALSNLRGFFTNLKPWKNKKSWSLYISRDYKRRWNIETGFREIKKMHVSGHERRFEAKMFDLYCRVFLYNRWQTWALLLKKLGYHHRDMTFNAFRDFESEQIMSLYSAQF